MRALHGAIHKAYCGNPHSVQATVKVLHHVSYHMLVKRCVIVSVIKRWLNEHAFRAGDAYSSWRPPDSLTVEGINGAWCWDADNLDRLQQLCTDVTRACKDENTGNVCV